MELRQLQCLIGTAPDGDFGLQSEKRFMEAFTNPNPARLCPDDFAEAAFYLRCSAKQIGAVCEAEGARCGFDERGRPLMLFDRRRFFQLTEGLHGTAAFSDAIPGGYDLPGWDLLTGAIATGMVDAAFMAASWGKFQVLGSEWAAMGYSSPWAMVRAAVTSEREHLIMLCKYLERHDLVRKLRAISIDPESCRPFAEAYNGSGYRRNSIHKKLAAAMKG